MTRKKKPKHAPIIVIADVGNSYIKLYVYMIVNGEIKKFTYLMPHGYIPLTDMKWAKVSQKAKQRGSRKGTATETLGIVGPDNLITYAQIGYDAAMSVDNQPLWGNAKYIEGGIDAMFIAALRQLLPLHLYPEGHDNIYLGWGMPPTEWAQQEKVAKLLVRNHKVISADGSKQLYKVRKGVAWDENAGGLVSAMSRVDERGFGHGERGRFTGKFRPGDEVIVFDGGGRIGSFAWATVTQEGFAEISYERPIHSVQGGIVTIRTALREALKAEFPDTLGYMQDNLMNDIWLDRILETGEVVVSGGKERLNARSAIEEATSTYLGQVQRTYREDYGGGLGAAHVTVTGGGSARLYPYIERLLDHGSILPAASLDNMIYANPRGGMLITVDQLREMEILPEEFQVFFEKEQRR